MQQAITLIPSTQSNDKVRFESESKIVRNEPVVLDSKLLRLISGGTDQPNKTW
jgi:hypothetical protein